MQEAMACGLPVLTTDDPAYSGSIVSDCCVVCPRDPDSYKRAINALLADAVRLDALSSRSRQVAVRRFDWRANFKSLMDVYDDLAVQLRWQEREA
jgi:glycosyltransferase involved in cell wall biosynthesis